MLDYEGLEALFAVAETGSFSAAASKLGRTQTAISQRIAVLEKIYGQPLLIRGKPNRVTEAGERLLNHLERVRALERMLDGDAPSQSIEIAANRDSLETWMKQALLKVPKGLVLHIKAADQDDTIEMLKTGSVQACITTEKSPLPGCVSTFLGVMRYVPVCSNRFIKLSGIQRLDKNSIKSLSSIVFDSNDRLLNLWLSHYFDLSIHQIRYFMIPSVEGFIRIAETDSAYGLVPEVQVSERLKSKSLSLIGKNLHWDVPLYWHRFDSQASFLSKFTEIVIDTAQANLIGDTDCE